MVTLREIVSRKSLDATQVKQARFKNKSKENKTNLQRAKSRTSFKQIKKFSRQKTKTHEKALT